LQAATNRLSAVAGIRARRSSRVYETEPVGGPAQADYLNAVLEIDTDLDPHELLRACNDVEASLGRVRSVRWGPRPIDIDVLSYDDRHVEDRDLVVPHPRMHERGFVLAPLLELCADPVLPGGRRVGALRLPAGALSGVRVVAPPLLVGAPQPSE
jgi:2-amino-4-hydroxy-6-hydroxymethyldihydropteridine diphosphokinase